jgi:DNA-binding LacI/PurR family transcriptional regulator
VTQQDIARMAGVSQTTVSVVLNGRSDSDVRIAPDTRDKVLRAIAATGYVADPVARRLAARHNRIIGVFTYESVFPAAHGDFYQPFLVGIEQRAESIGCDLLLLTSTPVVDGRRRIFHPDNRLRLADGCILLGRSLDPEELAKLVADGLPFVSIGRRDDAGGPVPYVGADYVAATAAIVERAVGLGHRRLAYLGHGGGAESWADRYLGFVTACARAGAQAVHLAPPIPDSSPAGAMGTRGVVARQVVGDVAAALDAVLRQKITAVIAEEHADGVALFQIGRQHGAGISVVTLGEPTRTAQPTDVEFSGLHIPRQEMGAQAVDVLTALIEGQPVAPQRLLTCDVVPGATLTSPPPDAPPRDARTPGRP